MESAVEKEVCAKERSEKERLGEFCAGHGEWQEGLALFEKTAEPDRPLDTYLASMDSSLTRLPSLRMIAGWFAVAGAAILAFIVTH